MIARRPDKGQPALWRKGPWYVRRALEARRGHTAPACLGATLVMVLAGACGGGQRQDANEPTGNYRVAVTGAAFPTRQRLAKSSNLVIKVKNTGSKTVPDIAVSLRGFSTRLQDSTLADPSRPVFVINGVPKRIGDFQESKEAAPQGGETAYVNTWALGPLAPGRSKSFRWSVTAVKAGPYRITYTVAAGLNGKARAVAAGGGAPRGVFKGSVSSAAPQTRVADDGKTVIEGTR